MLVGWEANVIDSFSWMVSSIEGFFMDFSGEKGRRIRELTSVVQKRFKFPENSVELYAEKVNNRGLCAIAQAESLRYKLLGGLAVRRYVLILLTFLIVLVSKRKRKSLQALFFCWYCLLIWYVCIKDEIIYIYIRFVILRFYLFIQSFYLMFFLCKYGLGEYVVLCLFLLLVTPWQRTNQRKMFTF